MHKIKEANSVGRTSIEGSFNIMRRSFLSESVRARCSQSSKRTLMGMDLLASRKLWPTTRNYLAWQMWKKRSRCANRYRIRLSFSARRLPRKNRQSPTADSFQASQIFKKHKRSIGSDK